MYIAIRPDLDQRNGEATKLNQSTAETLGNEQQQSESSHTKEQSMNLGAFSVSLAVKDLEVSMKFYEKFGFNAEHKVKRA